MSLSYTCIILRLADLKTERRQLTAFNPQITDISYGTRLQRIISPNFHKFPKTSFFPLIPSLQQFSHFPLFSFTEVISVVNASSTSQLHTATTVLDDVTETEFVGGSVKEEGDERSSPDGRNGRPSHDGRVKEGRSRLVGRREEGTMTEMVVDLIKFNID